MVIERPLRGVRVNVRHSETLGHLGPLCNAYLSRLSALKLPWRRGHMGAARNKGAQACADMCVPKAKGGETGASSEPNMNKTIRQWLSS